MNEAEAKKILQDAASTLPEALKNALRDPQFGSKVTSIAQKNGLPPSAGNLLEWQVIYVIVGFLPPPEFITSLIDTLRIPLEKARVIGQSVNEQLFRPIKDELKALYGITDASPIKKSIDAELEEKAGVKKSEKPTRSEPLIKDLEAILQEKDSHVVLPEAPEPVSPEAAEPLSGNSMPLGAFEKTPPAADKKFDPSRPMMIKTFARDVAEAEENLSRDEILQGIENPSSIPRPNISAEKSNPNRYAQDPYREPPSE